MEHSNKDEIIKESRWDRIRKKHINSIVVQTENVKKIFAMNFINENQLKVMAGDDSRNRNHLNPTLVMNMRHEIIRRNSKVCTNGDEDQYKKQDILKSLQMEKVKNHNECIETKYLDNELKKFKEKLHKFRPESNSKNGFIVELNELNNTNVMNALLQGHNSMKHFYKSSVNATIEENRLYEDADAMKNDNLYNLDQQNDSIFLCQPEEKCVRFGVVSEIEENEECMETDSKTHLFDSNDISNDIMIVQITPKIMVDNREALELRGTKLSNDQIAPQFDEDNVVYRKGNYESDSNKRNKITAIGIIEENPLKITQISTAERPTTNPNVTNNDDTLNEIINEQDSNEPEPYVQNSIISDLFKQKSKDLEKIILQKYLLKWIHHTTIEKISSKNISANDTRLQKIEQFLNNVRIEKRKIMAKKGNCDIISVEQCNKKTTSDGENSVLLARKYHNKMKIQQDIIQLQKLKLERQERMITELKLSKITEETNESKANVKQELRNAIKNGCAKLRSKARCIQIVGNIKDEETDAYAQIQGQCVPKFLVEMEQRALERNNRHRLARERREALEREKEEQRLAAEEAKRQQDEESKRQRIEELREKRRQEKLQKIQRENERLLQISNQQKANNFYRYKLLTTFGLDRFKILIKLKKRNLRKADNFRRRLRFKYAFQLWRMHANLVWDERKQMADKFYATYLKRYIFGLWKKYMMIQQSKMLVAIDWHEMKLSEHILTIWDSYTKQQQIIEEVKIRQADAHYNWHLKWRVIDHWQRLQTILKIEKETEERRQRWRMKIWELLPDYTPNTTES